jgi:hypothetical protein
MLSVEMEEETAEKKPKTIKFGWKGLLLAIVFVGVAGGGVYFYLRYQHSQILLHDPAAAAREELNRWVSRVAKHILLPAGESPLLATISDASQLSGVPFFANAKNGDIFLRYEQSGRAVLYRPSTDKVIEVTTIIDNGQPEVAGESTASAQLQTASLTVYNGTDIKGLAGEAQNKVESQMAAIQPIAKTNAKGNYKETLVVVLNPRAQDLGTRLKDIFNAGIGRDMPEGETKPETDLLLIVGEDFKP